MIKWIGQHIWDFVSRFRNDVYLESPSTTGSDPDKFLAIDSDNKIVYRTGAEVLSDIGAGSGDITGVTITTDTGSEGRATDTAGSADFSILGSTGVNVTNSGVTITATAVPAEIDHDSLSNFVANEHIDWTTDQGSTNIHSGNYTNTTYSEATSSDAGLMSTAHHDKLDGIETSADVTDATNVTAAGALMDSECSSLASVKALDQGVATGDSPQFAGINLGHASDTTIARSASGTVTIESKEIMTKDKKIHIQQTAFNDDLGTTEHFIPFNTTTEHVNITNIAIPMVMPVAGKLLKVHMRVNQNHNTTSNTVTFKLYDVDDGEIWNAGNSNVLGTKVIDGTAKQDVMVADFTGLTTSGASGTNAFAAGHLIGVTLQNSVDLATTNYIVTMVFELDFSSY